jgi:hypothetical protein
MEMKLKSDLAQGVPAGSAGILGESSGSLTHEGTATGCVVATGVWWTGGLGAVVWAARGRAIAARAREVRMVFISCTSLSRLRMGCGAEGEDEQRQGL